MNSLRQASFILAVLTFSAVDIASGSRLESVSMANFEYKGAFRLPRGSYGTTRTARANSTIEVNPANESFYFVGADHLSVAEFKLPEVLSRSLEITDLPMADPPIQAYRDILNSAQGGNPEALNVITGMQLIDGMLVVNAAEYYDGSASNQLTTLIVHSPEDLQNSSISGYFSLEGRVHAAGWMSPTPNSLKDVFGGDLILGFANNLPINGRSSMGPSAFIANQKDILNASAGEQVPTEAMMDYGLFSALHNDIKNETFQNDLWTELSEAYHGFIIPGTETYMVIGSSGGHRSGIGYKITQQNGYQCGGFCAEDFRDYNNYAWLWDITDFARVLDGKMLPSDLRPYAYGRIELPFAEEDGFDQHRVVGADFTREGQLLIVLGYPDNLQSQYSRLPIILVYELSNKNPVQGSVRLAAP